MAISMSSMTLNTRRPTAVATPTGLPRYARNDKVGAMRLRALTRAHCSLSLRGAPAHPELVEGRGNLDELDDAEHTSTNRRCHADGIATRRSH